MIEQISSELYGRFLRANNAQKKQVSYNLKGMHYGYFADEVLLGVISVADTVNTRRVKGFLVNHKEQSNGIGTELLKHVMIEDKDMTAFATAHSLKIFSKQGFEEVRKAENNITFMKKAAKKEHKVITDDEIELLKSPLGELAMQILSLEKPRRRVAIEYVNRKLKELIR